MLLRELLMDLDIIDIRGCIDLGVESIAYDSRKVSKNSLFICIRGFKTDGHLYIRDAIINGAIAIITEEDTNITHVTVIRVKNTRRAMAVLANKFFDYPSEKLQLVGITGTNGKTSTSYMVKNILEKANNKVGVIGTIANWIGEKRIETKLTTPEAIDFQALLYKMLNKQIKYCIMEVSSHSLELNRVDGSNFRIGLLTNLSSDHMDFHNTVEEYRNSKKKLFSKTSYKNIINIDDKHGKIIFKEIKDYKTSLLTYGIDNRADIMAKDITLNLKGVSFQLYSPDYRGRIEISIPGIFTVYNALAAIAISHALGIEFKSIQEGLRDMAGIAGRMDLINEFKEFAVIVDYAHTPDALENLLKSTRKFAANKLITVFGCGGDRDKNKRAVMGEIAGENSDLTIITSDNPRTENPLEILAMIEEGIKKTPGRYFIVEDRRQAISLALRRAQKGDIVLIAGKGHETYQTIGNKNFEFDDKKVALETGREAGLLCLHKI